MEAESQTVLTIQSQLLTLIPIAAIFSAIVTLTIRNLNERRSKIERTIKLHESFLSPEFYQKVRAPSFKVAMQWFHAPSKLRSKYRDTVCNGWASDHSKDKFDFYVPKFPKNEDEIIQHHFQLTEETKSLTEHQSLTSLLRFWTRFNTYRKKKLLNKNLSKELFKDEFSYQHVFFNELADLLTQKIDFTPKWVEVVKELTTFFELETKPNKRYE